MSFWKKRTPDRTPKTEGTESKLPPPREMICELTSPEGAVFRVYIQEGRHPSVWFPDDSLNEPIWQEMPREIQDPAMIDIGGLYRYKIPNPDWCAVINEALRRD